MLQRWNSGNKPRIKPYICATQLVPPTWSLGDAPLQAERAAVEGCARVHGIVSGNNGQSVTDNLRAASRELSALQLKTQGSTISSEYISLHQDMGPNVSFKTC